MSLVVDEHRQYLQDPVRLDAFRRAIAEVVRPGQSVLDLASGTGILGLLAFAAGASRVYSIESTGMVDLARAVAAANGLADRWTLIQGFSSHLSLPERVDVVVCDQIGHFGIEVDLLQHASDARHRFLKPGGVMIPASVDLVLAPVEAPQLFAQVDFWKTRPGGFDFSPARKWAANTGYPWTLDAAMLLAAPRTGATLDLAHAGPSPLRCSAAMCVERPGMLHGVGGWFFARLSPSVTMTNSPLAAARVSRRNVYFPVDAPVVVRPDDTITADMHIIPPKTIGWTVAVKRGSDLVAQFRHSTLSGMLLTADDLRRTRPASVPVLTPRGEARRSVLELCDGTRSLEEIEREVFTRHPDLFQSASDAALFVAEVVTRYTR